jgi:hypothetical protein
VLSTPRRKAVKLIGLAVILVSAFAAGLYYVIPDNPRAMSIAFALGPSSMNSVNSSVYSLATAVNVTFRNGTGWDSVWHPEFSGEMNSTDISKIVLLPVPSFSGGLDLKEPYLVSLQYAFDWGIHASSAGQNPSDLGTFQVANYTFSLYMSCNNYPIPPNYSVPELNYPLHVDASGYWDVGPLLHGPWTWRIDSGRIHDVIANTTDTAEVYFDLDLTVDVYYQIMTLQAQQAGYAKVAWSGRWATLQLFHDGDQLLGFRYGDTDIALRMMAS